MTKCRKRKVFFSSDFICLLHFYAKLIPTVRLALSITLFISVAFEFFLSRTGNFQFFHFSWCVTQWFVHDLAPFLCVWHFTCSICSTHCVSIDSVEYIERLCCQKSDWADDRDRGWLSKPEWERERQRGKDGILNENPKYQMNENNFLWCIFKSFICAFY